MDYNTNTSEGISLSDPKGYFTEEEVQRFIDGAKGIRDKLIIYLMYKTSRRVGELLQLKVKDINWQDNSILWHLEKPAREKWMPVSYDTLHQLKKYLVYLEDKGEVLENNEHIFRSSHNLTRSITQRRVRQIIEGVGLRIGITEVGEKHKKPHPHHFRHSFGVHMAKIMKTPADAKKASDLMGHINKNTFFACYLQFGREDLRELLNQTDSGEGFNIIKKETKEKKETP